MRPRSHHTKIWTANERSLHCYKNTSHSEAFRYFGEDKLWRPGIMGLLPDAQNCGLCMSWECRERFPHHQHQMNPSVSDTNMHHGTCVTHVPWCMSGSLTRGGGKTFPAFSAHAQPAILRIWYIMNVKYMPSSMCSPCVGLIGPISLPVVCHCVRLECSVPYLVLNTVLDCNLTHIVTEIMRGNWTEYGFINHETSPRGGLIGFNLAEDGHVPGETSNNLCYQFTMDDVTTDRYEK